MEAFGLIEDRFASRLWWLHKVVHMIQVTELYSKKMSVKMQFFKKDMQGLKFLDGFFLQPTQATALP